MRREPFRVRYLSKEKTWWSQGLARQDLITESPFHAQEPDGSLLEVTQIHGGGVAAGYHIWGTGGPGGPPSQGQSHETLKNL